MALTKDPNTLEQATAGNPEIYTEILKLTKEYTGKFLDLGSGQGKLRKS